MTGTPNRGEVASDGLPATGVRHPGRRTRARPSSTPAEAVAAMTFIALVRGINVGRAKQVSMGQLRAVVESLGYEDVRTLLRSGNVVFMATKGTPRTVAK